MFTVIAGGRKTRYSPPAATGLWVPMLQSDFSSALGTSATAFTDGGKWSGTTSQTAAVAEVIPAPEGEGWASPNCLSMRWNQASDPAWTGAPDGQSRSGYIEVQQHNLGEIAEGEIRHFRFGFASHHPHAALGSTDNDHHGIQDGYPSGAGSNQNWGFNDLTDFDGEWVPYIKIDAGDYRFYPISVVSPSRLPKGVKYTFDLQMIRGTGGNSGAYQLRLWVYDAAGDLVWQPSDYKSSSFSGETMATTSRWYAFHSAPNTRGFAIGLNGTTTTAMPCNHSNQGEVAIVSSLDNPALAAGTSIGPYGSVEGEDA